MITRHGVVAMAAGVLILAGKPRADERFERWDKNGDGKLAKEELPERLRPNFGRVDRDGDGFVSLDEHNAVASRRRDGAGQGGQQRKRTPMRVPANTKLVTDLAYAGTDNPRQKLDLLLPADPAKPLPLVAFIHGGAWRAGDKRGGINRVARLVATGKYVGASIGYRLSSEAQWPAQIYDCKAAIRWLRAHADEYGIDSDHIAVWGTSAGGHLVAMLGVTGGVEELEGKLGEHLNEDSRVTCVLDWFGPANLLTMNREPGNMDHDAPDSPESQLVGAPIQEFPDRARLASPVTYVTSDDPPFLIAHGTQDRTVLFSQGVEMAEALKRAGVKTPPLLMQMVGAGHGQGVAGPELDHRVDQFLDMHLHGIPAEISEEPIQAKR